MGHPDQHPDLQEEKTNLNGCYMLEKLEKEVSTICKFSYI